MLLAHKIELYPNVAQARYLRQCMGARRYAYNALLAHFSQDGVKWSKQAALRGVHLIVAPRYFASSKTCANCGAVKEDLTLKDRTHTCDVCGHRRGRDENAADNLEHEAYGLLIYQPHSLPADLKCALEVDQTDGVKPQRTIDKDRREEVYPEIRLDFLGAGKT